jgi:hypothetical protein
LIAFTRDSLSLGGIGFSDPNNLSSNFSLPFPQTWRKLNHKVKHKPGEDMTMAVAKSSEVNKKERSLLGEGDTLPYPTGNQEVPKTDLGWSYNTREG